MRVKWEERERGSATEDRERQGLKEEEVRRQW
jgi:hypothetical protein